MTIEMKDVCCGYKDKAVVKSFSAKITSGKILCLLGPNGVGKTTLFKCILGLLPLMGGSITVDGRDMMELSASDCAKIIGYVPQAHNPPFAFKVFDVVVMGRTTHLGVFGSPGKKDFQIAAECLERLEISHLANRVYTEISGGEQQMVLVARALAQEPAFLVMDEPTSNLDFGNQARVLKNICVLAEQGLGIIMTTHQPDHVFQCEANVSLIMPAGSHLSGSAEHVLTEQNLRNAYGIDVAVLNVQYREIGLCFCRPLIHDHSPGC